MMKANDPMTAEQELDEEALQEHEDFIRLMLAGGCASVDDGLLVLRTWCEVLIKLRERGLISAFRLLVAYDVNGVMNLDEEGEDGR